MARRERDQKPPRERHETVRQTLLWLLEEGPHTARELSGLAGIREKDVATHLEHLQRSLRSAKRRLRVEPARCLSCDYVFASRSRLSRPSACPRCRQQHIDPPVFALAD